MAQYEYVEGHTEPINRQLKDVDPVTGVETNAVLTGMSVEFRLYPRNSTTQKALSGSQYGFTSAAAGTTYFNPAAGDLLHTESPYIARWWVTDSGGKLVPYPDREGEKWVIRKP